MRISPIQLAMIAAALVAAPSFTASAGRAPTEGEKASIENVLREQGFASWDEVELEGEEWEVDDAVAADGKTYDLTLNAETLAVTEKEED